MNFKRITCSHLNSVHLFRGFLHFDVNVSEIIKRILFELCDTCLKVEIVVLDGKWRPVTTSETCLHLFDAPIEQLPLLVSQFYPAKLTQVESTNNKSKLKSQFNFTWFFEDVCDRFDSCDGQRISADPDPSFRNRNAE